MDFSEDSLKQPMWPLNHVVILYWIFKTMLAHELGRWHVFRDTPDWALIQIAAVNDDGDEKSGVPAYVRAANEELRLRLHRITLEAKRQSSS